MAEIESGAGWTLSVSNSNPPTFDQPGWDSLSSWEAFPCFSDLPELGVERSVNTFTCLNDDGEVPFTGVRTSQSIEVSYIDTPANAAQSLVEAAELSRAQISVKLENTGGTKTRYFRAVVSAHKNSGLSSDAPHLRMTTMNTVPSTYLEVNS